MEKLNKTLLVILGLVVITGLILSVLPVAEHPPNINKDIKSYLSAPDLVS